MLEARQATHLNISWEALVMRLPSLGYSTRRCLDQGCCPQRTEHNCYFGLCSQQRTKQRILVLASDMLPNTIFQDHTLDARVRVHYKSGQIMFSRPYSQCKSERIEREVLTNHGYQGQTRSATVKELGERCHWTNHGCQDHDSSAIVQELAERC